MQSNPARLGLLILKKNGGRILKAAAVRMEKLPVFRHRSEIKLVQTALKADFLACSWLSISNKYEYLK